MAFLIKLDVQHKVKGRQRMDTAGQKPMRTTVDNILYRIQLLLAVKCFVDLAHAAKNQH